MIDNRMFVYTNGSSVSYVVRSKGCWDKAAAQPEIHELD